MESLTNYGLEVGQAQSVPCPWNASVAKRLFQYGDWATEKVLSFVAETSPESLDREFNMGHLSIRKTLLHLLDAETWWVANWTSGPGSFPQSATDMSIREISERWAATRKSRDQFIETVDDQQAQCVVGILAGGPPTNFLVGESIYHLAIHGTHHRAQLINMCRHV